MICPPRGVTPEGVRFDVRVVVLAALGAAACARDTSDAELERLHAEAIAANTAATAANHTQVRVDPGYTLVVGGRLGKPGATLAWADLEKLATSKVATVHPQDAKVPMTFEGVLVRDLLDRFAAAPDADELTVVSLDGFRATVQVKDARANDTLLAIRAAGAPIPQEHGGPIYLIHPWSANPALVDAYPDRFWAFYVTHLIVGTEPARLTIGGKVFDAAALAAMPKDGFDGPVGFKVEWPSDMVHLGGVRLVDAIAAAKLALPPHGKLVIHGKAHVYDDPAQPIEIQIDDLPRCKPLLGLRVGLDERPIPARLGGPIVLAFTPCGERYGSRHWVTFVERIDVVPP